MNFLKLIQRGDPRPWSEGDNIPWNDPGFSQRMLEFHLSQANDAASRRYELIDQHVQFLDRRILNGRVSRVLDLGCGPGLYLQRLAQMGHTGQGIDFSPASIAYARQAAAGAGLLVEYTLGDLRTTAFGADYDLVMMIYGEFNVFSPDDARVVLSKTRQALKPGGRLVLEPSPEEHIRDMGSRPPTWYSAEGGLFSDRPHVVLEEAFWDAPERAATARYFVIDAASGAITRHAASYQAYTDADLSNLLTELGFQDIQFFPNLTGEGPRSADFMVVSAERG